MRRQAEPKRTRVLLVDRPGFARRALAGLVVALPGVELVGEVGDPGELAAAMSGAQTEVVIVDDRLVEQTCAGEGGIPFPLIVIGVDDDPGFAARPQGAGAIAWVAKEQADTAPRAALVGTGPHPAVASAFAPTCAR